MNISKIHRTNLCSQLRQSIAPSRRTLCLFISCSLAIQFASPPCQATTPAASSPCQVTTPAVSHSCQATKTAVSSPCQATTPAVSHSCQATNINLGTVPLTLDRLSTNQGPAAQHRIGPWAVPYKGMTYALWIAGALSLLMTAPNSYPIDTYVLSTYSVIYALGALLLYSVPKTPIYPPDFKHFLTAATFCAATLGPWFTTNLAYYHCVIFTLYITAATNAWYFHLFSQDE